MWRCLLDGQFLKFRIQSLIVAKVRSIGLRSGE